MKLQKKSTVIIIVFLLLGLFGWNQIKALKQEAFYKKGVNLLTQGNFNSAIQDLQQATRLNPKDDKAQRILGKAHEAKGELDKAVQSYEASLKINPNQPEVLYNAAIIYKSQGKTEAAIEKLEKAVEINDRFVPARLALGDLYKQIGDKEKAKGEYQTIIDMKPFGIDIESVRKKMEGLR